MSSSVWGPRPGSMTRSHSSSCATPVSRRNARARRGVRPGRCVLPRRQVGRVHGVCRRRRSGASGGGGGRPPRPRHVGDEHALPGGGHRGFLRLGTIRRRRRAPCPRALARPLRHVAQHRRPGPPGRGDRLPRSGLVRLPCPAGPADSQPLHRLEHRSPRALGLATAREVDVETLARRISDEAVAAGATVVWWSLVGAATRMPGGL